MKMRMMILTLATATWLAAQPAGEAAKKAKPPAKPPAGVPAKAKFVDEETWRYVDGKGKAWIYKKSPFGMMKSAELSEEEQQKRDGVADPAEGITVKQEGDLIRFSRPGPFGVYTWTKKKNELTDVETAAWERAQPSKSATKE